MIMIGAYENTVNEELAKYMYTYMYISLLYKLRDYTTCQLRDFTKSFDIVIQKKCYKSWYPQIPVIGI